MAHDFEQKSVGIEPKHRVIVLVILRKEPWAEQDLATDLLCLRVRIVNLAPRPSPEGEVLETNMLPHVVTFDGSGIEENRGSRLPSGGSVRELIV